VHSPASETEGSLLTADVSLPELFATEEWVEIFRRLRKELPISFCPVSRYGPYWSLTRLDDVRLLELDWRAFSSEGNIIIGDVPESFDLPAFATFDPPRHTAERKVVAPAAGQSRLRRLEPQVRNFMSALLDGLPIGKSFDWCERVSREVTSNMAALLFGLPVDDRHRLASWCERITASPVGKDDAIRQQAARAEFLDALTSLWHREEGSDGNGGIMSYLRANAATADMIHAPKRLLGIAALIAGANEAAQGAIAGGVVGFARHREEWEKLRADPGLLERAVAEMVRWQSPVRHMRRTATRDVTFGDIRIPAGAKLILWYCSANRDETYFEEPDRFKIDRPKVNIHAGFGFGIHRCFGRHVAMMELRILWEEILSRFARIEVIGEPQRLVSNFSGNYAKLTVKLHSA
jgi:cytochrome P450